MKTLQELAQTQLSFKELYNYYYQFLDTHHKDIILFDPSITDQLTKQVHHFLDIYEEQKSHLSNESILDLIHSEFLDQYRFSLSEYLIDCFDSLKLVFDDFESLEFYSVCYKLRKDILEQGIYDINALDFNVEDKAFQSYTLAKLSLFINNFTAHSSDTLKSISIFTIPFLIDFFS